MTTPKYMFLSFSGLINLIANNKVTDEILENSLFYFGCHSSLCLDIELFKEYSGSLPEKHLSAFNKCFAIFTKYPKRLLCRKDILPDKHIETLNNFLTEHGWNTIQSEHFNFIQTEYKEYETVEQLLNAGFLSSLSALLEVANGVDHRIYSFVI